ncbi:MAG: hypothetical protein WD852_05380 [Methyloceanibacter sp.]
MLKLFLTLVFGIAATPALACMFDTDCGVGSKCVKRGLYGICAGGMTPGNKYDREPVYDPLDLNQTTGNTCSFDLDCGIGAKCYKKGGIEGVCIGR